LQPVRSRSTLKVCAQAPQTENKPQVPAAAPAPNKQKGGPNGEPPKPPKKDTRPVTSVALDNFLDTVSDVWRHVGRQLVPLPEQLALDKLVADGSKMRLAKTKPVVLVLGSGWGAHSMIKVIDTDIYDVVLVSPRNHFLFTPMLPSTAVGTVEFRSLLEPIRTSNPFVTYFEATCDNIDTTRKVASCTSAFKYDNGVQPQFEVPYDILVVAVGEQPATFGVPGVRENCFFMKEITDTVALRNRIGECFELAALPGTSVEDRQRLLSFVVVGGGPTGVEFAGTLSDFVRNDLKKKYPRLMKYVKVSLLQSAQTILTQFDGRLAKRAMDNFLSTGVDVRTGVRVVEVTRKEVVLKDGGSLPYGVCVWSTGNAAQPLVQQLVDQIPEQAERAAARPAASRKLSVDSFMRVVGARDIVALGDCSSIIGNPLPATAQVAGQQGAYLAHLINRGYEIGVGGETADPPSRPTIKGPMGVPLPGPVADLSAGKMSMYSYTSLDEGELRVATSNSGGSAAGARSDVQLTYYKRPFEFLSLGIMAYVGNDMALTQIEAGSADLSVKLYGRLAFLLWRSVYITKQVSFRNRVLILFDWVKTRMFGRDTSLF